jgi:hypothetical protein
MKMTMLLARRHCLVCDAESTVEEPEDTFEIGTPCRECGAPTDRVEVLRRRTTTRNPNPHAAALGRIGGLKGGLARAARLSPERRREIARAAAQSRWQRRDSSDD